MPVILLRLLILSPLVMVAFAANSLLNRAALASGFADPIGFTFLRVLFGAVTLLAILSLRSKGVPKLTLPSPVGVFGLTLYLLGFSYAYLSLDAGFGALVLFSCVQFTMFAWHFLSGGKVPLALWIGTTIALVGLAYMLWPTGHLELEPLSVASMVLAGIGWGLFSAVGTKSKDALALTTWSFVAASILMLVPFAITINSFNMSWPGIGLALISGAITSGLGYALWYSILPGLGASRAALLQLTVPVIATVMGVLLLSEEVGLRFAIATALILGGTALGVLAKDKAKEQ